MRKLLIALITFSGLCFSADRPKIPAGFDPRTDVISEEYEAGPYLIYDCKNLHWVCVMEPFYKKCQDQRPLDNRACSAIGQFPTKKSCFQRQLFLTSQNHGNRFCSGRKKPAKDVN